MAQCNNVSNDFHSFIFIQKKKLQNIDSHELHTSAWVVVVSLILDQASSSTVTEGFLRLIYQANINNLHIETMNRVRIITIINKKTNQMYFK